MSMKQDRDFFQTIQKLFATIITVNGVLIYLLLGMYLDSEFEGAITALFHFVITKQNKLYATKMPSTDKTRQISAT